MTPEQRAHILANAPAVWDALKRLDNARPIRCGDTVHHRPSGGNWVVAYADYSSGDLAWMGWPEGYARIVECDLIACCTDAEHRENVGRWLASTRGDHRHAVVRRLYGAEVGQ